ncbi:hypothetical protein VC83_08405 [Pseudogymnoascus destructans]|uniref:Uncharacterized protein n=1 Tax=Pseudogymnoascus destructans TaxID=655981 RepID=A0A177A1Z8_9PEZI|nr:uncharacterized protein VC83_08405 [Pseudogymnoascus destructans]OAF55113.1 hypothetical protein VC83_08405 [Pseudogymnoascus destructans]
MLHLAGTVVIQIEPCQLPLTNEDLMYTSRTNKIQLDSMNRTHKIHGADPSPVDPPSSENFTTRRPPNPGKPPVHPRCRHRAAAASSAFSSFTFKELALASANTTVLVINDDEHQQVVVGAGSAAPATAFLGADEECPSLLPPEDPEAELLLDGPIIQGEDEGVDVEILGATDLHLELRKRPFGWEGWGGIFGEGFRATMRAGII